MRRRKEIKINEKMQRAVLEELTMQVYGIIEIEVGNYAYKKGLELEYETSNGIDVYIKNDELKDDWGTPDDICHIIHLHREDLLWFVVNLKENKKKAIKYIDEYIENKFPKYRARLKGDTWIKEK